MLSKEDNELITRVGPGTPMGELFRRYWLPAMLSEELPEPDCAPVKLRLLGEDLVAFRATNGQRRRPGHLLPAPQREPVLGPQRGRRPALRLPRLEVRRRRQLRRHAERAAEQQLRREDPAARLPGRRQRRLDLGLHGPARARARRFPHFEWTARARRAALRPQAHPGLQLAAEPRGRGRFVARPVPARQRRAGRHASRTTTTHDRHPVFEVLETDYGLAIAARRDAGRRPVLLAHHAVHAAVLHDHPARSRGELHLHRAPCRSTTRP